jgi:hypothetical protein
LQSYGLAQRLLDAPDVVVHPGPGFVLGMMAVLTGGSIVAMLLSESTEALLSGGVDSTSSDAAPHVAAPHVAAPQLTEGTEPARPISTRASDTVAR